MFVEHLTNQLESTSASSILALLVPMNQLTDYVVSSLVFVAIGILLFGIAFWLMVKMSPFSVRKEIEEDHNTALAIVIASVIIGIALIVSAAIHG
jgi:putative membrane protein